MLADLGRYFGWHQRTELVNDALERRLGELDTCEWYTERDFTVDSVPIPFTVFGPGGLFLLMGTRGHWTAEHVCQLSVVVRPAAGADSAQESRKWLYVGASDRS